MESVGKTEITEKIQKREDERQAEILRRRDEKEKTTSSDENVVLFSENFSREKSKIEEDLEKCDVIAKNQLAVQFDNISESLQSLQKYLADSKMYLPKYEVRQAQESLNKLQTQIQSKREILLPKKKFAFKSKKKGGEKAATKLNHDDKTNGVHKKQMEHDLADCKLVDKEGEMLEMSAEDINKKDVALARLHKCTVKLFGAPSTIHMKGLKDCTVLCGPASSSVFISDCKSCTFVLACQQLRTHTSSDSHIYLHVTSRAIIEDCHNLEFAPYNLSYPELDVHFKISGLDQSHNNWKDVDDFNWLATDVHSPNWCILNEGKRKVKWS